MDNDACNHWNSTEEEAFELSMPVMSSTKSLKEFSFSSMN